MKNQVTIYDDEKPRIISIRQKQRKNCMRKVLTIIAVIIIWAMNMKAQNIQVVDKEGNAIPLATILTESGVMIGTTNLEGMFDMKGAQKLIITHVAYKPLVVNAVSVKNNHVTMEDNDYNLTEIVVKPKPYIYVETYYRVYVYRNDSLGYYHCGIMPNIYEPEKKKFNHGSYNKNYIEYYSSLGVAINWSVRADKNKAGQVRNVGVLGNRTKNKYYVTTDKSNPNCWLYSNPDGIVGQLIRNGNQVRTTLDASKMQMYANKINDEKKMLEKRQERGYKYQFTLIGNYKEEGEETDITDFIMETDHWEYNDKKGYVKFIIECYATNHGYMDKNEWDAKKKELKQENKKITTLKDIEDYERKFNIPALPATVYQAIQKLKR